MTIVSHYNYTIKCKGENIMHRNREYLGTMECSVVGEPLIAGMPGTIQVTYTTGTYGIDDGGSIFILRQGVTDWQPAQTCHPSELGYTTAKCSRAGVKLEFEHADGIRPYENALRVRVRDGCLQRGDTVTITMGDTSFGSPGILTQTVAEKNHKIIAAVDPFNCNRYEEIHPIASLDVRSGSPAKVDIILPSKVKLLEDFKVKLRVIDMYGNACEDFEGSVLIDDKDGVELEENKIRFTAKDRGSRFVTARCTQSGVHRLNGIEAHYDIPAESNVCIAEEAPEYKLFWGDMHEQNNEASGLGTMRDTLWFAEHIGMLDFTGWQGNDFEISDKNWENVREELNRANVPGRFVTFLGYEWSGVTCAGGDHNIYFLDDCGSLHRSSEWIYKDGRTYTGYGREDDGSDRYPISQLWETFKDRTDVMAIPHVGGRAANFDFYNPELTKVIEIYSHHGIFDWFLDEAVRRKMKVGFIAASDDHTSRVGLSYPIGTNSENFGATFDVTSGLTAVYAKELSREGIWEALMARRCYASTNGRIVLDFRASGHMMGEEFDTSEAPQISISVNGASPVCRVELYRDLELLQTFYQEEISTESKVKRVKVVWSGVRTKFRKKSVLWDGSIFIRNGRLVNAEDYSIDRPNEGIQNKSNQYLNFRSKTSGDEDGVILDIIPSKTEDCRIIFTSRQKSVETPLSALSQEPIEYDAGPENCRIKFSLEPAKCVAVPGQTYSFTCSYTDKNPEVGLNIYYVRVFLNDGGRAWSSPIFVNFG